MILRFWNGWTLPANADAYERLLRDRIAPGILQRGVRGFLSIEILRRDDDEEVHFATVMRFEDREAVIRFAGDEYREAVVPPEARALLARFDRRSTHFEILETLEPD